MFPYASKDAALAVAAALDRAKRDRELHDHVGFHMARNRRFRADTGVGGAHESWVPAAAEDEVAASLAAPREPVKIRAPRARSHLHFAPRGRCGDAYHTHFHHRVHRHVGSCYATHSDDTHHHYVDGPCHTHVVDTHVYQYARDRAYDPFAVQISLTALNRADAAYFDDEIRLCTPQGTPQDYHVEVWCLGPEHFPTYIVAAKFRDGFELCGRGQTKARATYDALCGLE